MIIMSDQPPVHRQYVATGGIQRGAGRGWTIGLAVGGVVLLGAAVAVQLIAGANMWAYILTAIGGSAFLYAGFLWFRLADRTRSREDADHGPDDQRPDG